MIQRAPDFYASVQHELANVGQDGILTNDERDLVDDYEQQEFSPAACAGRIARMRKAEFS